MLPAPLSTDGSHETLDVIMKGHAWRQASAPGRRAASALSAPVRALQRVVAPLSWSCPRCISTVSPSMLLPLLLPLCAVSPAKVPELAYHDISTYHEEFHKAFRQDTNAPVAGVAHACIKAAVVCSVSVADTDVPPEEPGITHRHGFGIDTSQNDRLHER